MPLHVQDVTPDMQNKRGTVYLWNNDPNSNDQVNIALAMNFTGNETLNQAQQMIKDRAKQVIQAAVALL